MGHFQASTSAVSWTDDGMASIARTPNMMDIDIGLEIVADTEVSRVDTSFPLTFQLPTSFDDLQTYMQLKSMFGRCRRSGFILRYGWGTVVLNSSNYTDAGSR